MRLHSMFTGRFLRRAWRLVPAAMVGLAAVLGVLVIGPSDSTAANARGVDGHREHARTHRGDAARGERLFRDILRCVRCHGELGAGGHIGPDLKGVGSRHDREYLITAVLEPSRDLVLSHATVTIDTLDDQSLGGRYVSHDAERVTYADSDGQMHSVGMQEIEKWALASGMPGNFDQKTTPQEFADLIAFLEAQR